MPTRASTIDRRQVHAAAPLAFPSAAARDASIAGAPADLAPLQAVWAALHVLERAALPLAEAELRLVAARIDAAGSGNPNISPFLSASLPAMPFPRYALHVAKATGYGHEGLAVGLALMARYAVASGRGVTPLSMHRLFATCMQLGMKTASDKFVKNSAVAPLLCLGPGELTVLEFELARALDFGTLVTAAELTRLPEALAALPKSAPMSALDDVFVAVCTPRPSYASAGPFQPPPPRSTSDAGWLVEMYPPDDAEEDVAPVPSPASASQGQATAAAASCYVAFGTRDGGGASAASPPDDEVGTPDSRVPAVRAE